MNTTPTSPSAATRSDSATTTASAASSATQPASAFELLFGSIVLPGPGTGAAAPAAPRLAPSADQPEPTPDAAAAAAELTPWLQQLPLAPLPGALAVPRPAPSAEQPEPVPAASPKPAAELAPWLQQLALAPLPDAPTGDGLDATTAAGLGAAAGAGQTAAVGQAAAAEALPLSGLEPVTARLSTPVPAWPPSDSVDAPSRGAVEAGRIASPPASPSFSASAVDPRQHAASLFPASIVQPAHGQTAPPLPTASAWMPEHTLQPPVALSPSGLETAPPGVPALTAAALLGPTFGSKPDPNRSGHPQPQTLPARPLHTELTIAAPVPSPASPPAQPGSVAAALPTFPSGLPSEVLTKALLQRTEQTSLPPPATPAAASAGLPEALQTPLQVALPPGSAPRIEQAFNEGMAVRLQWMAQQQVGRAEIQLHPADLGSIDVQIEFEGKAVRAEFLSASGDVRQLLEAGLPRLRELLEAQGLQLQHADVGSGNGRETGRGAPPSEPASRGGAVGKDAAEPEGPARPAPRRHDGSLSEYA